MTKQENQPGRASICLRLAGQTVASLWLGFLTLFLIAEWVICQQSTRMHGAMLLNHHLIAVGLGIVWATVITLWRRESISAVCLIGEGLCLGAYIYLLFFILMVPGIAYFIPGWDPFWVKIIPTYPILQGFKEIILPKGDNAYPLFASAGFLAGGLVIFVLTNIRFKRTLSV